MPLVPMRAILEATEKYNYAQGAFNVNAVAQAKAVIEVHEMFRSAAIIQGLVVFKPPFSFGYSTDALSNAFNHGIPINGFV